MSLWMNGVYSPDFWDSPPIAINLDEAWQGYPNELRFKHAILRTRDQLLKDSCSHKTLHIQRDAYSSLVQAGFRNDLKAHASKHVLDMLGLDGKQLSFNMDGTFKAMRKIRKHEAMQVVKTWCNSWATSYRYHEDPLLPCLLGCTTGIDDFTHYLVCPHIWSDVQNAFPNLHFSSPFERLCINTECTECIRVLAAVFQAYHTVKSTFASLPLAPFDTIRCTFFEAFRTAAQSSGLRPASASFD